MPRSREASAFCGALTLKVCGHTSEIWRYDAAHPAAQECHKHPVCLDMLIWVYNTDLEISVKAERAGSRGTDAEETRPLLFYLPIPDPTVILTRPLWRQPSEPGPCRDRAR